MWSCPLFAFLATRQEPQRHREVSLGRRRITLHVPLELRGFAEEPRVVRPRRRLEQERNDGRALLANFVATYGKLEEFKEIAGQITAFLNKARKVKPCPPA